VEDLVRKLQKIDGIEALIYFINHLNLSGSGLAL
jgi:hypothetical protein